MSISYLAAFLGGMISLVSPCSAMVVPTFASAVSNQRERLLVVSAFFSAGLLLSLLPLSLGAWALGALLLTYREFITTVIGWVLVILAGLVLFGTHLPLPRLIQQVLSNRKTGLSAIFSLGMVAGLGSTTCVGPILGAILSLAAASSQRFDAVGLLIAYAMGMVVPVIGLSLVVKRWGFKKVGWLRGRVWQIGSWELHSSNLLAAFLLLFTAWVFIAYQGSLSASQLFRSTGLMEFMFDLQDSLYGL